MHWQQDQYHAKYIYACPIPILYELVDIKWQQANEYELCTLNTYEQGWHIEHSHYAFPAAAAPRVSSRTWATTASAHRPSEKIFSFVPENSSFFFLEQSWLYLYLLWFLFCSHVLSKLALTLPFLWCCFTTYDHALCTAQLFRVCGLGLGYMCAHVQLFILFYYTQILHSCDKMSIRRNRIAIRLLLLLASIIAAIVVHLNQGMKFALKPTI